MVWWARRDVLLATAVVLGAPSCTRDNPAFGSESETDGHASATDDAGEGTSRTDGSASGHEGPGTTDTHDSAATSDTTDTEGDADTTGIEVCEVPPPKFFSVKLYDGRDQPIVTPCGDDTFHVGHFSHDDGSSMMLNVCETNQCPCEGEESDVLRVSFHDLLPAPTEVLEPAEGGCVQIRVLWDSARNDCIPAQLFITVGEATTRAQLIAVNRADNNLTTPAIVLGEPHETCDEHACNDRAPGDYGLVVPDFQIHLTPGGPSQPVEIGIGNHHGLYELRRLFGRIDSACQAYIGWSALAVD